MRLRIARYVLSGLILSVSNAFAEDIAVVVHADNPTSNLSTKSLRKMLVYEKNFWADGSRIILLMRETGSSVKDVLLRKVYGMGDQEVKRLWLLKLYKGEIPSAPNISYSDDYTKEHIARIPGAIGFIEAGSVDGSVKVIAINGKWPGEHGYPLRQP